MELDAAKISANLSYDPADIDKGFDGVTMTVDTGSVWTVTGESSLRELTIAEGASVRSLPLKGFRISYTTALAAVMGVRMAAKMPRMAYKV